MVACFIKLKRLKRYLMRQWVLAVLGAFAIASIGTYLISGGRALAPVTSSETESGTVTSPATVVSDSAASGGSAIKFGSGGTSFPDGTSRPHMISGTVMAYTDANGVAQQVTLKPLPTGGSSFGLNNCAFYDARGWVDVGANCVVDGYNFNGVGIGNVNGSNVTISRNWFHNIDGQDSWAIWTHSNGTFTGLTVTDNLVQGTSTTTTGPDGLLKVDGNISNVVIQRNHSFNSSSFVQFASIYGSGTAPYGNIIADNYIEVISDPSNLGLHLEQINISSGTGGLLIQHNYIIGPTGQTATIYICHDAGNVGNITIDNNLLGGKPQITEYSGDTGAANGVLISAPGNIKITNNKLDNSNGQNPGTFGLFDDPTPNTDARVVASGNVWYPSLTPIPGL